MSSWGPYGTPEPTAPQAETGVGGTVKIAAGLTMFVIALCLIEAGFVVYLQQSILETEGDSADLRQIRLSFGTLIGANLVIAAGLGGGAVLALRRSVAGKALIWVFGSLSALLRCGCGAFTGIFVALSMDPQEADDMPLSTGMWTVLLVIEIFALLLVLAVMIMLMTKGASFKDPAPQQPYGPPGSPGGPGYGPGSPAGPPMSGPPNDGLPQVPPTPGWPGG